VFSSYLRDSFEEPSMDGGIILKWIFREWGGCRDWVAVAQIRHRWQAVTQVAMKFQFP
jgi:hypothetical protein